MRARVLMNSKIRKEDNQDLIKKKSNYTSTHLLTMSIYYKNIVLKDSM